MSAEILETVTIKTANGDVRINKADYDPAVHQLVGGKKAAPVAPPADTGVNGYFTKKNGKKGGASKFLIVDKDGKEVDHESVNKEGYSTEGDAQAVMILLPPIAEVEPVQE